MDRFFQNDRLVKVLSVVLAALLWFTVSAAQTKQEELIFDGTPLRVYPPPAGYMVMEGPQDGELTVRITAKGSRLQLSRLDPKKLQAYVDYVAAARSGAREAAVVIQPAEGAQVPAGVQLTAEPSRVPVYIAKAMEKSMPVRVFPSPGEFVMDGRDAQYTAIPKPGSVVITGPEEYVARVAQLQVNLQENEVTTAGTLTKQPVPVDERNVIVQYVQVPPVEVEIAVSLLPPAKQVLVRPSFRGALPEGYQYSPSVEPQTVKIRSNASLVGIEDVRTEPIDLTGRTESFEATVRVLPPQGATAEQETVTVAVTVTEVEIDRTFEAVPIQVTNRPAGTDLVIAPAEVQVRLRGYRRYLDELSAAGLVAYVDLAGLPAGTHVVPVRLQPPGQGIEILSIGPRTVDVTITEVPTDLPEEPPGEPPIDEQP